MNNYTANDIQTLDFRTAIRSRIAMYMGSADNQGVLQGVREIITNSIDEATMGYGNKITIELFPDNLIQFIKIILLSSIYLIISKNKRKIKFVYLMSLKL